MKGQENNHFRPSSVPQSGDEDNPFLVFFLVVVAGIISGIVGGVIGPAWACGQFPIEGYTFHYVPLGAVNGLVIGTISGFIAGLTSKSRRGKRIALLISILVSLLVATVFTYLCVWALASV